MSYATLNGERIISGQVVIPRFGVWHADIVMAMATALEGVLRVVLGNLTLVGARFRALSWAGSRGVRIVGGAGGWSTSLPSKYYRAPGAVTRSVVIRDAARAVGETVEIDADQLLGDRWTREEAAASRVLDLTAPHEWFVRPDGVTQIGHRTPKEIATPYTLTSVDGALGRLVVGTEDIASWQPDNTFTPPSLGLQQTISTVMHTVDDGTVRTEVLTGTRSEDRLRDSLAAFVRSLDPRRTFFGFYEYVAVSQDGDTISARPTDPALGLPELVDVPMRPSILGGHADLPPGSKVLVGFVNGSPSRPEVLFADIDRDPTKIVLAGGGDTQRVIRQGDLVTVGTASGAIALSNPLLGSKVRAG